MAFSGFWGFGVFADLGGSSQRFGGVGFSVSGGSSQRFRSWRVGLGGLSEALGSVVSGRLVPVTPLAKFFYVLGQKSYFSL